MVGPPHSIAHGLIHLHADLVFPSPSAPSAPSTTTARSLLFEFNSRLSKSSMSLAPPSVPPLCSRAATRASKVDADVDANWPAGPPRLSPAACPAESPTVCDPDAGA